MADKPDTWLIVMVWLSQQSPMFYAVALSCWIGFLGAIYGGDGRRQALLEYCLCDVITAGAFPRFTATGKSIPKSLTVPPM